ncbi:ATP-binding cassette, subfamily F, uup [Paucidesulfovibrio gracilis DSM 16080]|uniref:ATP-binding protein Uup n=1 Tax=Paucidesulfovibrio gracilis DSM 16080 TaxID=1121449 RepID=A0A1T4W662_9BACT|nr:ATP-binding cassette domain-containing protein [Paucidesulfovibrio gracilis]SKA72548.1 ATP-binding cassette, subfamily F, uup [Paucidesulfovibrio gracilis DSM 16080]
MALLSARNLSISFGGPLLLDDVSFQVEEGQRVCIVGRNGQGKSTLLRLLSGDLTPDSGQVVLSQGVRVARLSQKVPEELTGTIYEVVTAGLGESGTLLARHQEISTHIAQGQGSEADQKQALTELARLESRLEELGSWEALSTVDTVLSHLSLDPAPRFETLSGGLKRRALLARALAGNPDVLLLDEPTNHLDIASIAWLEEFLLRQVKTLVFITHDRMFLRRVATRIIELDRGHLADWSCDYDTFLERRDALLENEEKQWAEFDKKLAAEEAWIRRGLKARRTRNMGRVRALEQMRRDRDQRRERLGKADLNVQEAGRSGKMVVEATDVSFAWDGTPVFRNLNTTIMRGDRVGLIGPNGAGKTTLLQVLLGRAKPDSGTVRLGTNLEIAYFDQHREELDPERSVRDSVAEGNDYVTVDGNRRHVMGYLKSFLFEPDRAVCPVRLLSGGERNRLLLARLFTRPSNLLIMDEPTNDLDAETLELLEDRLMEYQGTVLIVSHDRAFLNNVVTSTLALEGDGCVAEYVGGYDDWLRQRPEPVVEVPTQKPRSKPAAADQPPASPAKPRKLSYKEQREQEQLTQELADLPARIETLESDIAQVHEAMSSPEFYKRPAQDITEAQDRLAALEAELESAFARWEEAETRLEELGSN